MTQDLTHITETQELLAQVFAHHQTVVLWLSGGKDSTTLLHLARPWASRIMVLSVLMDNGHPGIPEHVETICRDWGYGDVHVLSPPIDYWTYVQRFGWPSKVLLTKRDGNLLDPYYPGGQKISSWWLCSTLRVLTPLVTETQNVQADAVLTASRRSDAPAHGRVGPIIEAHDVPFAGWTRYDPIWSWRTSDVYRYIDQHEIPLPPIAQEKRKHDFEFADCVECPFNQPYVKWLQKERPEAFREMWDKGFGEALHLMQQEIAEEMAQWEGMHAPLP
jgi:3'-phosphoadenosine 5'-phosphosulfate sulfotransferase (PAPS reductase)/FAD synthetase